MGESRVKGIGKEQERGEQVRCACPGSGFQGLWPQSIAWNSSKYPGTAVHKAETLARGRLAGVVAQGRRRLPVSSFFSGR